MHFKVNNVALDNDKFLFDVVDSTNHAYEIAPAHEKQNLFIIETMHVGAGSFIVNFKGYDATNRLHVFIGQNIIIDFFNAGIGLIRIS